MVAEVVPDMTPEELFQLPRQEVIDESPRLRVICANRGDVGFEVL